MGLKQILLTMSDCGSFVKQIAEDIDDAIEHILICDPTMTEAQALKDDEQSQSI